MKHGVHSVTATFIGDDISNPPSESPSRGYFNIQDVSWTFRSGNGYLDHSTAKSLISPSTIPDFAISAKPNGQTYATNWVPSHAGKVGLSLNPHIKVFIDGSEAATTGQLLLKKDYVGVKSFEIAQSFNANNPDGTQGTMWTHYIRHSIKRNEPCLVIQNSLEVSQETMFTSTYLTMTGVDSRNFSRLALNNGVEYNTIPKDGSDVQLDYDVSSALYAGESGAGIYHGTAVDVNSYAESVGLRKRPDSDKSLPGLLTFRADNIAKFYLRALPNNTVLKRGDVIRNTQRLVAVGGVRYPNVLIKTL